jgi:hypothetical protein
LASGSRLIFRHVTEEHFVAATSSSAVSINSIPICFKMVNAPSAHTVRLAHLMLELDLGPEA